MTVLDYAAHVDHGVDHSDNSVALGLSIVGAVAAAAIVISTGGAGLTAIALAGTAGNSILTIVDLTGLTPRAKAGVIVSGLDSVRLGPQQKQAARANPDTKTSCGHEIVEGSREVVLGSEFAPMSRRGDKEGGGGMIIEGMSEGDQLIVGGPRSQEGVTFDEHSPDLKIASLIYTALGLPSAFTGSGLSKISGALDIVSEGANQANQDTASTVTGLGSAGVGVVDSWSDIKGLLK